MLLWMIFLPVHTRLLRAQPWLARDFIYRQCSFDAAHLSEEASKAVYFHSTFDSDLLG